MKEFCALRPKAYAYIMDDGSEKKKAKGTKKCIMKCNIMFKDHKDCLFNNNIKWKSQKRFKSDHHNVYTIEFNKIALISNDDKRLKTFDRVTTYPYGALAVKCVKVKWWWWETYLLKNM